MTRCAIPWAGLLVGYSNMAQEVGLDEYNGKI